MKLFWCCLLGLGFPFPGFCTRIEVGSNKTVKSIQKALGIAKAGDQIVVQSGLYKEKNLVIDKSVELIGVGWPILDGEGKHEIISIKANGVRLQGFRIQHSGYSTLQDPAGIKIYDSRNVTISGNELTDTFFGIYVQYSQKCTIINNKLTAYGTQEQEIGNGIHCWKSDSLTISGNRITGHRDGIYFEFVTHSSIRQNISEGNLRYGLHFMFSHNDAYVGNTFRRNGAGVAVMFTHGVTMKQNRFEENWGDAAYGLLLKEISDSRIEGNHFTRNTSGIYMEGANRIEVCRNSFSQNGWAMKVQASCMDVQVENNNFVGNTFDVATNGSLVLNRFDGNYWDKYEGYDLNRDKMGDVPFRPVSLFAVIIEKIPAAMFLLRSIITTLIDKSERVIPSITPGDLLDTRPWMKPLRI